MGRVFGKEEARAARKNERHVWLRARACKLPTYSGMAPAMGPAILVEAQANCRGLCVGGAYTFIFLGFFSFLGFLDFLTFLISLILFVFFIFSIFLIL